MTVIARDIQTGCSWQNCPSAPAMLILAEKKSRPIATIYPRYYFHTSWLR